jgi:hypothetical protein
VTRLLTELTAQPGDQLALGQARGGEAIDPPRDGSRAIDRSKPSGEPLSDGSRSEDEEISIVGQAGSDGIDEGREMLEPTRLARRLVVTATVPGARIVSNVTGRAPMGRHV